MKIGILGVHGSIEEHIHSLKLLDIEPVIVKKPEQIDEIDGLIIPGGESTTMIKLIKWNGLDKTISEKYKQGKLAIYGTCAGAILLSKTITNYPNQPSLELIDIEIDRNGYGRQIESFEQEIEIFNTKINCIFIRAPIIKKMNEGSVITEHDNHPILIEHNNILISTFHPELTDNTIIHKHFLEMCKKVI